MGFGRKTLNSIYGFKITSLAPIMWKLHADVLHVRDHSAALGRVTLKIKNPRLTRRRICLLVEMCEPNDFLALNLETACTT